MKSLATTSICATDLAEPQVASSFAQAKASFDAAHRAASHTDCIVPVRGKPHAPVCIRTSKGTPNEEYYKWQFIHALVKSGLYPKDYIGVELHFPKGNKGAAALKARAQWALVGNGTLLAMITFVAIGLAVGHVMGGPDPDHSVVLALSTACRHPGIGLSIAAANFPDEHFAGAILLYVIVGTIVTVPYLSLLRRMKPAVAH